MKVTIDDLVVYDRDADFGGEGEAFPTGIEKIQVRLDEVTIKSILARGTVAPYTITAQVYQYGEDSEK